MFLVLPCTSHPIKVLGTWPPHPAPGLGVLLGYVLLQCEKHHVWV